MSAGKERRREIERKFLVRQMPDNLSQYPHMEIAQGYHAIAPDGVQVRLRKAGEKRTLTFKRNDGGAREEREIELTAEQFDVLWPATGTKRLTKTRYDVPFAPYTIEIDVYTGRHQGLVVEEVEFADEGAASTFQPPPWLGSDVSNHPRYSNQLLANS